MRKVYLKNTACRSWSKCTCKYLE